MKRTWAWIAVWCTKTSGDPSAGVMNPKPLTTSKNLTLPELFISRADLYSIVLLDIDKMVNNNNNIYYAIEVSTILMKQEQ